MPKTDSGIAYRIDDLTSPWRGRATPVLLHHGIGTDRNIWANWVPILCADRAVIRMDMRGWGASAGLPAGPCEMRGFVDDVAAVLAAAGVDRAHLCGESLGGTVVLATAVDRPDLAATVHMSNASFKGAGLGEVEDWRTQFAAGVASWSDRMMTNRFGADIARDEALAWFAQTQARTIPEVAIRQGQMLSAADLSDGLAQLMCPVSMTLPDQSPFVPVWYGNEAKRLNPSVDLQVVPGVRHGLPFSHAAQEATLLRDRLARLDRA